MRKLLIYVFSGTGNTKVIAEEIIEEFRLLSYETEIFNIKEPFDNAPDPNLFDFIGFGYPIHAFNSPKFFLSFVKQLPNVIHKPTFIFKTSGEPFHFNDASSWSLVRLLKKKGFIPLIDEHFLMPYNIVFRYPEPIAKYMYLHNKKLVKVLVKEILAKKNYLPRYYPWTIIFMFIARIQWFGAKINGPLIHVNKSKCIACNICVKQCPSNNIKMVNGYPRFDHRCTMCMGCAAICPVDAVRPGVLTGWRVNGLYPFKSYDEDQTIPNIEINRDTKGYFRLFSSYYKKSNEKIKLWLSELE